MGILEALAGGAFCGTVGLLKGMVLTFLGPLVGMLGTGLTGIVVLGVVAVLGYMFVKHHIIWIIGIVLLALTIC
ncbi:MAG: hypothetical protein ABEJ62_02115 [Candidatus Nanohaloarchaea archaeon]